MAKTKRFINGCKISIPMATEIKKITKYERARILGARATQLSSGAPLAVELSEKELEDLSYDVYRIAKVELERGKLPIKVYLTEKKSEVTEEILKKEAELVKLERDLNIRDNEEAEDAAEEKSNADSD